MQHENSTWLNSSARIAVAGRYGWIMCGIAPGVSYAKAGLTAYRSHQPNGRISLYVQLGEARCRGIWSIELMSGTAGQPSAVWRVTLDWTSEFNHSSNNALYGSSNAGIWIEGMQGATGTPFNKLHTIRSGSVVRNGNRASFQISNVTGGAPWAGGTPHGSCCLSSDAHSGRWRPAAANGWMLRNAPNPSPASGEPWTVGRLIGSGVDNSQRCITPLGPANGSGETWAEIKAAYDKANIVNAYEPDVGPPVWLFRDNENYQPRASGDYLCNGTSQLTTTVASAYRSAHVAYYNAQQAIMPNNPIIGNFDTQNANNATTLRTLNFAEYPNPHLHGCSKESVYDGSNTSGNAYIHNDGWAILDARFQDERTRIGDPTGHSIHCQGGGANTKAQMRDWRTANISQAACLCLPRTMLMREMTWLQFGAQIHDVTGKDQATGAYDSTIPYWHTCQSAPLGNALTAGGRAALPGKTHLRGRFFDNGAVIVNPNNSTESFTPADLDAWKPAAHAGRTYRFIGPGDNPHLHPVDGEVCPHNTGLPFTSGSKSLGPWIAVFLVLNEND